MSAQDLNAVLDRIAVDTRFVGQLMQDFPQAIAKNGYALDEAEISAARAAFDAAGDPPAPPFSSPTFSTPPFSTPSYPDPSANAPRILLPSFPQAAPAPVVDHPVDPDVRARQNQLGDFTLSLLKGTLNNAKLTYQLITLMNAVMFLMGVGLFLFAAIYGANSRNLTFTAAFAGLGVASFVALFLLGPIDKTQDALSNLIQAEVAFMNYFDQMCFLEACAQCPAPGTNTPCVPNIERASALLQQRTQQTLDMLQTYLENRPARNPSNPSNANPHPPSP